MLRGNVRNVRLHWKCNSSQGIRTFFFSELRREFFKLNSHFAQSLRLQFHPKVYLKWVNIKLIAASCTVRYCCCTSYSSRVVCIMSGNKWTKQSLTGIKRGQCLQQWCLKFKPTLHQERDFLMKLQRLSGYSPHLAWCPSPTWWGCSSKPNVAAKPEEPYRVQSSKQR